MQLLQNDGPTLILQKKKKKNTESSLKYIFSLWLVILLFCLTVVHVYY